MKKAILSCIIVLIMSLSHALFAGEIKYEDGIGIDDGFPGGNIIVTGRKENEIYLKPDLRDTKGDWFYTAFRVRGAQGKTLRFKFDLPNRVGARGPAISNDCEKTWHWLSNRPGFDSQKFTYTFDKNENEVIFATGPLYTQKNWDLFIAQYKGKPEFVPGVLCNSRKGTPVELLRIGSELANGKKSQFGIVLSARHHCCEMIANYVLEGIIEEVMSENETGTWLRAHCRFLIVPFMDKPGVEAGDQGKNRIPHDHNRDYIQEIYPSVKNFKRTILSEFKDKEVFFTDLHCPWIRSGKYNERIYSPSVGDEKRASEIRKFSLILAEEQKGKALPYNESFNLPFGVDWNTDKNYKRQPGESPTMPSKTWAESIPNAIFVGDYEIPYANASDAEVNPVSAREFGHSFARSIVRYLKPYCK